MKDECKANQAKKMPAINTPREITYILFERFTVVIIAKKETSMPPVFKDKWGDFKFL